MEGMMTNHKKDWPACYCGVLVRERNEDGLTGYDIHVEFGEFRRFAFLECDLENKPPGLGLEIGNTIRGLKREIGKEYREWQALMEAK